MIARGWTLFWVCLFVASRSFVSTAPPRSGERQQAVDEDVRELQQLKPSPEANSLAVMKSHSVIYTNINGQKEHHENRKEQVEKNGELLARVEQEFDKSGQNSGPHIKTKVDIPSRNLHKVIEHGPNGPQPNQDQQPKESPVSSKHRLQMPLKQTAANFMQTYRPYTSMQYSPLDMAEYVFWTGDERGATSAIEEFLQDGLMTRDEAIGFLEEIKQNLELLKSQYQTEDRVRLQAVMPKIKIY